MVVLFLIIHKNREERDIPLGFRIYYREKFISYSHKTDKRCLKKDEMIYKKMKLREDRRDI